VVVVIGIGGSYLGAQAVTDALSHQYLPDLGGGITRAVYVGNSLSANALTEVQQFLDTKNPIVNVISKTGETTETAIAFAFIENYMKERYGANDVAQRIVVTTDAESGMLRSLSEDRGYKTFDVPRDIGGRFSVLSAVGLLPISLCGFNAREILGGADALFASVSSKNGDGGDHPCLKYAQCRVASFKLGYKIELLAYSEPKLRSLINWCQQLFAESEGKSGNGMFPVGASYSADLHSIGQMVQDGPRTMIETFLSFRCLDSELKVTEADGYSSNYEHLANVLVEDINRNAMLATKVAHADGGVPCLELSFEALNERGVGGALAFFELSCGVSAAMLGVNPYDQPAVESYKRNLFGLLGRKGFESLGENLRNRLSR